MDLNVNLFSSPAAASADSSSSAEPRVTVAAGVLSCPSCSGDMPMPEAITGWHTCPFCAKRLQIRAWPAVRQNNNASAALSDQATCFFHPEKAFQACCQRCGRFVCALCDLQLGAEHVCPTCFERGRGESGGVTSQAEWRYRDVLYDSVALTLGWGSILFWPAVVVTIPATIFLHVKYRKAPRAYLIPRSGWRFWVAYLGFIWPLLVFAILLVPATMRRH